MDGDNSITVIRKAVHDMALIRKCPSNSMKIQSKDKLDVVSNHQSSLTCKILGEEFAELPKLNDINTYLGMDVTNHRY